MSSFCRHSALRRRAERTLTFVNLGGNAGNMLLVPFIGMGSFFICADTTEEAERLALSQWLWKKRQNDPKSDGRVPSVKEAENYPMTKEEEKDFTQMKEQMIIGDPNKVRDQLTKLDFEYEADEYMVITIVHDPIAKRHSYTLLQEVNKNIARNSR